MCVFVCARAPLHARKHVHICIYAANSFRLECFVTPPCTAFSCPVLFLSEHPPHISHTLYTRKFHSIWEAETAEMTANYAKCREREESLRERLEEAERSKREEVLKIMVEWEGVYKELETLYFAARFSVYLCC